MVTLAWSSWSRRMTRDGDALDAAHTVSRDFASDHLAICVRPQHIRAGCTGFPRWHD